MVDEEEEEDDALPDDNDENEEEDVLDELVVNPLVVVGDFALTAA